MSDLTFTKALPEEIAGALRGLQMQAGVVTESLPSAPSRTSLSEAHHLMAAHKSGVRDILRFVKESNTSVPDIKADVLRKWLEDEDSVWISHEKPNPAIYLACVDDGPEPWSGVYFLTSYWGDLTSCGGQADSRDKALEMMIDLMDPYELTFFEKNSKSWNDFLAKLKRPDLASHISTVMFPK